MEGSPNNWRFDILAANCVGQWVFGENFVTSAAEMNGVTHHNVMQWFLSCIRVPSSISQDAFLRVSVCHIWKKKYKKIIVKYCPLLIATRRFSTHQSLLLNYCPLSQITIQCSRRSITCHQANRDFKHFTEGACNLKYKFKQGLK